MKWDFGQKWPEICFSALLIVGFITAVVSKNAIFNYLTIFLAGIIIGQLVIIKAEFTRGFFFYVVIAGFIFGYLFGTFNANRFVSFLFLILGIIVSSVFIKDRLKNLKHTTGHKTH